MTIEIVFLEGNKPVAKVSMTCNNLYNKILSYISDEDYEKWFPGFDATEDITVTTKECIVKVWNSCIEHNYISQDFDMLSIFIDKMKIIA